MLSTLLAEAQHLRDAELIEAISPGSSASTGELVQLEETGVPAALLTLVAQRGQTELLERLLRLQKRAQEDALKRSAPGPLSATGPLPTGPLATHKKMTDKEKTAVLQKCIDGLLETALVTGDGEAVACLLPEYEAAVMRGHLKPELPRALASFAALAARRGDKTSLAAMRKAGAVEWVKAAGEPGSKGESRFKEDDPRFGWPVGERMDCLSSLQASPKPPPPSLTSALAPGAGGAASAAAAAEPTACEGLLREGEDKLEAGPAGRRKVRAQAAPTHARAPARRLGSLRWPPELAPGRPDDDEPRARLGALPPPPPVPGRRLACTTLAGRWCSRPGRATSRRWWRCWAGRCDLERPRLVSIDRSVSPDLA